MKPRGKLAASVARRFGPALLLSCLAAPAFAQGDPSADGSLPTTTREYEGEDIITADFPFPVEFKAVVYHPTDLGPGRRYPLVLYLHGRHATCGGEYRWPCPTGLSPVWSYRGYAYSGQQLASHGYIVVSISVNGINAADQHAFDGGMLARARLIDEHLEFWRILNTTGAAPFGTGFVDKVDLTRVGTMGHSRGGEGVLRHVGFNATKSFPFPLKTVVPIAPTNANRFLVNQDLAVSQILPYCDGDVKELPGVHYYDDARYQLRDAGYHGYVLVMGANHNFFNTVWTPGGGPDADPLARDDWSTPSDPHCGTGPGNGRLTAGQQQEVGKAYLAAFFRTGVGGEPGFFGYIDGTRGKPPSLAAHNILASYHGNDRERLDLNQLDRPSELEFNNVGGEVTRAGLSPYDMCGGPSPQPRHCLAGSHLLQPHTTLSAFQLERLGLNQLRTGWSATTANYVNTIAPGQVGGASYLNFRVAVNPEDSRNPAGLSQDFRVRFTSTGGTTGTKTLRVGEFSNALLYPPGDSATTRKTIHNQVRLPLATLAPEVDVGQLTEVAFLFDQKPAGALLVSDIHFYLYYNQPSCGDGGCTGDENCENCEADCGPCPPFCGDGSCNGTEDCETCELDCDRCPTECGNEECEFGEDEFNCCIDCECTTPNYRCESNRCVCTDVIVPLPQCGYFTDRCGVERYYGECPAGQVCRDNFCEPAPIVCGDGRCDSGETGCCQDCGCEPGDECQPSGQCQCVPNFVCGDGVCESACGETEYCPADCGGTTTTTTTTYTYTGTGTGTGTCSHTIYCCEYDDCCPTQSCYYESVDRSSKPGATKGKPAKPRRPRRQGPRR